MATAQLESFYVMGITVRTSNHGNALEDITGLWSRFMGEELMAKIPNRTDGNIYSVYCDYEGDYTEPYTALLGCRVSSLDDVPAGMEGRTIPGGAYDMRTAKGNLNDGIVVKAWHQIWEGMTDRTYGADFEVYGEKAMNPADAEVDIYVGIPG